MHKVIIHRTGRYDLKTDEFISDSDALTELRRKEKMQEIKKRRNSNIQNEYRKSFQYKFFRVLKVCGGK